MVARKLEVERLHLDGAFIIKPMESSDERGLFCKSYTEELLKENGVEPYFHEEYISISKRDVIRGLHYQAGAHSQAKLVQCVKGEILDVILDLRKGSRSFGKHASVPLSERNLHSLFVPRGFAHGFASLSDSMLIYHADNRYSMQAERGVRWDDPSLGIEWNIKKPIISAKDRMLPLFKDAEYF